MMVLDIDYYEYIPAKKPIEVERERAADAPSPLKGPFCYAGFRSFPRSRARTFRSFEVVGRRRLFFSARKR
jgi:hypothetical protein